MAEPLKNVYTPAYLERLADAVSEAHQAFPKARFLDKVFDAHWPEMELKQRMHHIARRLKDCLPTPFETAVAILKDAAPGFGSYEAMFFPDFVETFGQEHWDVSMDAMAWFTRFSSSEFAVRPFFMINAEKMTQQMLAWSKHENYHVRRLASEGSRPRLPWAMALPMFKKDPSPILPILENLKQDPEEYVRRSVANNLNDIAKDHPKLVLEIAERWLGLGKETDKLVKHACRTLLKAGNQSAMRLFGFGDPDQVTVSGLSTSKTPVTIGNRMAFKAEIKLAGNQAQLLRLEYAVDYLKANGKHSRKVFKISEKTYEPGRSHLHREHDFQNRTTRKHYPGPHRITLLINGLEKATVTFDVLNP